MTQSSYKVIVITLCVAGISGNTIFHKTKIRRISGNMHNEQKQEEVVLQLPLSPQPNWLCTLNHPFRSKCELSISSPVYAGCLSPPSSLNYTEIKDIMLIHSYLALFEAKFFVLSLHFLNFSLNLTARFLELSPFPVL